MVISSLCYLPNRQLRNIGFGCEAFDHRYLPNRQLRNSSGTFCASSTRYLPNRQLRKCW